MQRHKKTWSFCNELETTSPQPTGTIAFFNCSNDDRALVTSNTCKRVEMAGLPPPCIRGMASRDASALVPWREANQPDIVRAAQKVM